VALSEHQRVELGGIEYRALKLLMWILVVYQIFWIGLGVLFFVSYAYRYDISQVIQTSQPGELNPGWWAFFTAVAVSATYRGNIANHAYIVCRASKTPD